MFAKGLREDTEFGEESDTAEAITPLIIQFAVADHRAGRLRFLLLNSSFNLLPLSAISPLPAL